MVTLKIIIGILSTGRQYLHHFAPIYENIAILYFWITLERCLLYLTNTLQQTVVASFKSKLIYEANIQLLMHTNIQRNINSGFCNYSMKFSFKTRKLFCSSLFSSMTSIHWTTLFISRIYRILKH